MEKKFYALRPLVLSDRELTILSDLCKKQRYMLDLDNPVPKIKKNDKFMYIQRDHGELFVILDIQNDQIYQNLSEILKFAEWIDRAVDLTTRNLQKRKPIYRAAEMLFKKANQAHKSSPLLSIIYLDT